MRPQKAYFELTRACNLACSHCLNNSGKKGDAELANEAILAIVRDLLDFGIEEIRFTGGEPTLHGCLLKAISLTSGAGKRSSIGTNGVLITRRLADTLKKAGLHKAIISLDGDACSHDVIRGTGSYRRTWKGIRELICSGVSVRVNAIAMKSTMKSLDVLAERCAQEGVSRLNIRRFIPSGRGSQTQGQSLTIDDYQILRQKLAPYIASEIVTGHYLQDHPGRPCSAGTSGLVILADGSVHSCGFLAELGEKPLGNALRSPLSTIWNNMAQSVYLKTLRQRLTDPVPGASDCLALAVSERFVQIRRTS